MDGVVLLVDDKIDKIDVENDQIRREPENELFETLRMKYPVLGIKNLELAKVALNSVGSFSAVILDWIFEDSNDLLLENEEAEAIKGVQLPKRDSEKTLKFLEENDFYSLVYIYSNESVEEQYGDALREKFPGRIIFRRKGELDRPAEQIAEAIEDWKAQNQSLSIPLTWSASINKSMQQIFKDLSDADRNWLREVYESAKADQGHPELFVVEIFQSLLAENLVQAEDLLTAIREFAAEPPAVDEAEQKEKAVASLFNRIFYTKLHPYAPLMTGDIIQTGKKQFGIIVSPECDIGKLCDSGGSFDVLKFSADSFDKYLKRTHSYEKAQYASKSQDKLDKIARDFNQNQEKLHILPSFPLDDEFKTSVVIDFSAGISRMPYKKIAKLRRTHKLNTIFLQQLRQRFLAFSGRIGVPTLPTAARLFNLK